MLKVIELIRTESDVALKKYVLSIAHSYVVRREDAVKNCLSYRHLFHLCKKTPDGH